MVRAPYYENGLKKGAWGEEEDKKLIAYVERYGHPNWRQLPKFAGLARCGKSCRLRWMNYLRPNLKRGKYTQKEEQLIMDLHKEHGNKWSLIAENLPGRTDNEIKNYWHSHLKKFLNSNDATTSSDDDDEMMKSKPSNECTVDHDERSKSEVFNSHNIILESSLSNMSSETSYTEDNNSLCFSSGRTIESNREEDFVCVASWETTTFDDGFIGSTNFWTQPFVSENALSQDYCYLSDRDEPFFIW